MIVLDEQLQGRRIAAAIERWYPGKVINIRDARLDTDIPDPDVPSLLHHLKEPTFVTINWSDFWTPRKTFRHPGYCIICLKLPRNRVREVPIALRDVLRQLPTKKDRMGKIVLVGRDAIEHDLAHAV